jgi:hypothetical protein
MTSVTLGMTSVTLGMTIAALCGLAWAEEPPPPDVWEVVGHGVRVDWTTLRLEVQGEAWGTGAQTPQAVEQLARREVEAVLRQAVGSVRVTSSARVADLVADEGLGEAIASRIERWDVTVATYGTSGRVALTATLSLQDLLKPWTLQISTPGGERQEPDPSWPTGLVVDARGLGVVPAYAPRIVDAAGTSLYAGELHEDRAVEVAPYVFVSNPAHPAAGVAGANPLRVQASDARGSDLVISEADAASRLAEIAAPVLSRGAVVVVVDGDD